MGKKSKRKRSKHSKQTAVATRQGAIQERRNKAREAPLSPQQQANHLRETFATLSTDINNKWNHKRLESLYKYWQLVMEVDLVEVESLVHKAFLKKIYKDQEELSCLRALALDAFSRKCIRNAQYEDASQCLQNVIKICHEATDLEKQRLALQPPHASAVLGELQRRAHYILQKWRNLDCVMAGKTVGGDNCDLCGKFVEALGTEIMSCCGRCQLSYYCSRECQTLHWNAGHKQTCRKKGEWKVGDTVEICDPDAVSPTLCTGVKFFHLLAPVHQSTAEKWLISAEGRVKFVDEDGHTCFAETSNLLRIRSEKWYPFHGKQQVLEQLLGTAKTNTAVS